MAANCLPEVMAGFTISKEQRDGKDFTQILTTSGYIMWFKVSISNPMFENDVNCIKSLEITCGLLYV